MALAPCCPETCNRRTFIFSQETLEPFGSEDRNGVLRAVTRRV
jgi:hypothetical protein